MKKTINFLVQKLGVVKYLSTHNVDENTDLKEIKESIYIDLIQSYTDLIQSYVFTVDYDNPNFSTFNDQINIHQLILKNIITAKTLEELEMKVFTNEDMQLDKEVAKTSFLSIYITDN